MRIELRYFTGTGNSLKVMTTIKEVFAANNNSVNLNAIKFGEKLPTADLIGFCFPVYAFGIPRICRQYLNQLAAFEGKPKVFILVTAGDADESGFSIREMRQRLRKKNCRIIYSAVIQMPINWTTSPKPPFPPNREEARKIVEKGVVCAKAIAKDLMAGREIFHRFNYPERYGRLKFYNDYLLFKWLGIANLWRTFAVYANCSGCGTCAKVCPTKSISIVGKRPVWSSTCEQCMRCVNSCPREAIYQTMRGDTKGKNKYLEGSFDLKL